MLTQGHRAYDSHSISSQTSNATSRVTTLSDASDPEDFSVRPKGLNVSDAIGKSNYSSLQRMEKTSPITDWINQSKTNGSIASTQPDKILSHGKSNGSLTSRQNVEQLIPGSILINDRGEIYDRTRRANHMTDSLPTIESNGTKTSVPIETSIGYLAPTHIQRQIVTSPGLNVNTENSSTYRRSESTSDANTAGHAPFNRQQTFPGTSDKNLQTWVNPYWPQTTPAKSQETSQPQQLPPSTTTAPPQPTTPWVNPYWPTTSAAKPQEIAQPQSQPPAPTTTAASTTTTPWVNPYWGTKPVGPTAQPKKKKTTVLHHAWEDQQTAVFTFDFLPTPSFYERIYPLNVTAYSTNVPSATNTENDASSSKPPAPIVQNIPPPVSAQPPTVPTQVPSFSAQPTAVPTQAPSFSAQPPPFSAQPPTFPTQTPSFSAQPPAVPAQPSSFSVQPQFSTNTENRPDPPRPRSPIFQNITSNFPAQSSPSPLSKFIPINASPIRPVPAETNQWSSMPRSSLPFTQQGSSTPPVVSTQPSRFELGQIYPSSAPSIATVPTATLGPNPKPGRVDLEAVIANRFPREIPLFSASPSSSKSRLILYPLQKQGSVVLI